jgi:hypothetical protein
MSAEQTELVEVAIGGVAKVPAKFAPLISVLLAQNPALFQEVADGWIAQTLTMAGEMCLDVDELIAKVMAEAKA